MICMLTMFLGCLAVLAPGPAFAEPPVKDTRADLLRDPDHYELRLKPVKSLDQWEARKKLLRESLLIRAGLWPEPPRTPLNARIFGEVKGGDTAVQNAALHQ